MEKVIVKAETRAETGKRCAKNLRKKGVVPAVVYKGDQGAVSLQVGSREITDALHTKAGSNVIITLKIEGGEKTVKDKTVIIKEIQHDPVKDTIMHIDFNEISLTETLKVNVPLASKGDAAGVKQDNGVLEHILWELHVECLPTNIPEKIECDVSNLKIGDSILVKQIPLPEGVKVLNDPELIAFIVKPPHVEKPPEEALEAAAEPELIREKKKEEETEEAAEGAAKQEKAAPAKEKEPGK